MPSGSEDEEVDQIYVAFLIALSLPSPMLLGEQKRSSEDLLGWEAEDDPIQNRYLEGCRLKTSDLVHNVVAEVDGPWNNSSGFSE